jgi:hypothetical protein
MNLVTLYSLSLAALSLAAPAVAAVAPSNVPPAVRSAPDLPFEHPADEVAAVTQGESFVYAGSTDPFSAGDHSGFYKSLDADAILNTANLYAVVYADGNAWEPLLTMDDFTIHGAAHADGD